VKQIATGSVATAVDLGENECLGLTFSPDDNYLFYVANPPNQHRRRSLLELPLARRGPEADGRSVTGISLMGTGTRIGVSAQAAPHRFVGPALCSR